MSGHLSTHPYIKSYDELTRSKKRMENYATINGPLLPFEARQELADMIQAIQKAIDNIPEEYQKERYKRK